MLKNSKLYCYTLVLFFSLCSYSNISSATLVKNIEQFNYGGCCDGLLLGWLDDKGLGNLELLNDQGTNVIESYFKKVDNKLVCAAHLKIFMASNQCNVARTDCLFYVVNNVNNYL